MVRLGIGPRTHGSEETVGYGEARSEENPGVQEALDERPVEERCLRVVRAGRVVRERPVLVRLLHNHTRFSLLCSSNQTVEGRTSGGG